MHIRQHIADLPVILHRQGIEHVIISPGSRNAPLINSFFREFGNACISIVDERSAAYVGLGIASYSKVPVVLICTSGTAALNYAPAMAEAFHQGVPLIAITADRPPEWIDQQDNQTIRQAGIYASNCKASVSFPVEVRSEAERLYAHRLANEAYNLALSGRQGPVHINIPLREPLYEEIPVPGEITCIKTAGSAVFDIPGSQYSKIWREAERILLVAGQQAYNPKLTPLLERITEDKRVCLISEPIANLKVEGRIENPEPLLALHENNPELGPDLLICFGGQVVSNRLKQFLRCNPVKHGWFIDPAGRHVDTFLHLSCVFQTDPAQFFEWLSREKYGKATEYGRHWHDLEEQMDNILQVALKKIEYSDLGIIQRITASLPGNALLFAGNSSIVRYLGFFRPQCIEIFSNRGTSGIDGCLSTATGIALATNDMVIALTGDQSFIYDSNALWNRSLPENLKVIVINNQGGGIFAIMEGPSSSPAYKSYFEAHHPAEIAKLSEAFAVSYYACRNYKDFDDSFKPFLQLKGPAVYEIFTPREVNPAVFRTFVSQLKKPV
jgi:2-succinyl-5-enolpyruvyl-6-hydroxy-3-cyclohexene-1-carboxylate synthase